MYKHVVILGLDIFFNILNPYH